MIKFEHTEVVGWEHAIRGMRNPMNSWEKSDSFNSTAAWDSYRFGEGDPEIGPNDLDLMKQLRNAGTDHRKFMRMITVYVDITAPLYWWKEFDTYKVGTVANSCSTMHKIAAKRFERDDFSHEHLMDGGNYILNSTIDMLNEYRAQYLDSKDKKYWWQIIQLLPSSYNQKRTVMLNYEVLANIYKSRQNHRLDEWCLHITPKEHEFCNKDFASGKWGFCDWCALPGFVDSKNEEKTERNAGYLVVSQSGGGMLRQGTRKGIRRTPANRGMRAHWIVKSLDISEDVCHGLCP